METALRSAVLATLAALPLACSDAPPQPQEKSAAEQWSPEPLEQPHLPNAYRLHKRVISGGQPEGEAGYEELSALGVKTVISVDGARPPVELAEKHGLRYVHLPIGYDGVPEQRARELAGALRDLPGLIYIHCHHGKHRSPAAAAVACVGAGMLPPEDAPSVLQAAGTSESYRGLYRSAERARRFEEALLDGLETEFPETVDVPPIAEAMVAIERTHDRLKLIAEAGWKVPDDHPDLDPPHEALMLREHFTELLRTGEVSEKPPTFQRMLRASEAAAGELEAALRNRADSARPAPAVADRALARISAGCTSCHRRFRDVPLGGESR